MSRDQIEAQAIIVDGYNLNRGPNFEKYDRIYPFATENIKGYMTDATDQDVLTVEASGDQRYNALVCGASRIDTFDINRLTTVYTELKDEIIRTTSFDQFLHFISSSKESYDKVKRLLSEETREFWDWYHKYFMYGRASIFNTNLFYSLLPLSTYDRCNNYFNQQDFMILKESLYDAVAGDIYNCDVNNLPKQLRREYDRIYLSNIINYQRDIDKFKKTIAELYKYSLKPGGALYYGYFYEGHKGSESIYLEDFQDTEVINVPDANGKGTDDVLVLRKK